MSKEPSGIALSREIRQSLVAALHQAENALRETERQLATASAEDGPDLEAIATRHRSAVEDIQRLLSADVAQSPAADDGDEGEF